MDMHQAPIWEGPERRTKRASDASEPYHGDCIGNQKKTRDLEEAYRGLPCILEHHVT